MERIALTIGLCMIFLPFLSGQAEQEKAEVDQLLIEAEKAYDDKNDDELFDLSKRALAKAQAVEYEAGQAQAWRNIGFIAETKGDWAVADSNYHLALDAWRSLGDSLKVAKVLRDLSILKEAEGKFEVQLQYAREGYQAAKGAERNGSLHGDLAIDLANSTLNNGDYELALELFQEAVKIHSNTADAISLAKARYGLANILYRTDKLDTAKENITQAISTFTEQQDTAAIAQSFNLLGAIFLTENNSDSAVSYFQKSLELAEFTNDFRLQSDAYFNLIELVEEQAKLFLGQPQIDEVQANQFFNTLEKFASSEIIDLTNSQRLILGKITKHWQLDRKSFENEQQKNKLIIGLLALLLLILFTTFLIFRTRKQRELLEIKLQKQTEQENHRQKINNLLSHINFEVEQARQQGAQEKLQEIGELIHNTIGSDLTAIKWNLETYIEALAANGKTTSELEEIVKAIIKTMNNARSIERMIERATKKWLEEINVFLASLQNSKTTSLNIEFQKHGDNIQLPPGHGIQIFQMIKIIVSNTLTHAKAQHFNCQLNVFDKELIIIAQDDGKGFDLSKARIKEDSSGINNLESMVAKLKGEITIDSATGKGTTTTITLPITE